MSDEQPNSTGVPISRWQRALRALRPTHAHSVFSATLVLMASTFLSSVFGLVRNMYIAWLFGGNKEADVFFSAFQLPDMISYFLVGGAASITFVTILTKYRETGRDAEGERSLSVILTTMLLVLGFVIVLGEIFSGWYVHWAFPGFDAEKAALCVRLTRILLPAQLCFFAGGVFGAVLLVRKQFNVQAVAPLIYNLGTILGGLFLVKKLGVSSLALGTVGGAFVGPFLLNAVFARRAGVRYRPILDWRDEGLREWVKMSLPLIVGVSLTTADTWIMNYFASHYAGAISLISYAKRLFVAPMAVLAQAAGAASMPFFASLWAKENHFEFATKVADSVSRVVCLGLLAASAMMVLGKPAIDLLFVGGKFSAVDGARCAAFFAIFALSMCFWSAQAIYSRAFYAAGNMIVPMAAGTVVTVVALPIYAGLFHHLGAMGLVVASDIGITMLAITMGMLLHRQRMVSLASLDYREMSRCLMAAFVAGFVVWGALQLVEFGALHMGGGNLMHKRAMHLVILLAGLAGWLAVAFQILQRVGSALPQVTMRRLGFGR